MSAPLPSIQYVREEVFKLQDASSLLSAYETILTQEGSLLLQPKSDKRLRTEVHSCGGSGAGKDIQAALVDLGEMYVQYFIRIFKIYKSRTLLSGPSPSSFDTFQDMIKSTLVSAPRNHEQAKKNALIRDRFRCVLTGPIDGFIGVSIKELRDEIFAQQDAGKTVDVDITQCTHILSESIFNIDEGGKKLDYAASVWSVLSMFGYKHILDEMKEEKIHRLENILTLSPMAHHLFGRLSLWFEKTETENTYNVGTTHKFLLGMRIWPQVVNFTTTDPNLALPSAEYLSLHAAAAKVAHLSGAAEYLDDIYQKRRELDVLSSDGSPADVPENALYLLIGSSYLDRAHVAPAGEHVPGEDSHGG